MAAVSTSTSNLHALEPTPPKSSSPTSPIVAHLPFSDQSGPTSRSFINLSSPRAQISSLPVTPMTGLANNLLDPPAGTLFADFLRTWSDAHVAKWLTDIKCGSHVGTFKDNDIRGDVLLEVDQETLKEMGIASIGDRLRIVNGVKGLRQRCSVKISAAPMAENARAQPSLNSLGESRSSESIRESHMQNGLEPSHSRDNSRDNSRDSSPTSRMASRRLESVRPAPLVLSSSSGRGDLPRLIREPQSGDSGRSVIRPLPQPASNGTVSQATTPNGGYPSSRPLLPPLPPAPRGQPPQPPSSRSGTRNLHALVGPRARTPNQADTAAYANSPLPPAPGGPGMLTPSAGNAPSNGWSAYGLPSDPRSANSIAKPPIRSPSPLGSRSSPRSTTNPNSHNRNISFGGVSSPLATTPTTSKLPPRPSTTGNSGHPYASAQAHSSQNLQTPSGQNMPILSPIAESFRSSSGSSSPPAAFTVGRGPFNPSSHNVGHSVNRKLVKFVLPDEGRSCIVDVADCAGGIEVMEKVMKKFDKVASRRNDSSNIMNRVDTDDGGLSVDGWSVYLEWGLEHDAAKPLSEAELLAVCHGSSDDPVREQGLTLRRTGRAKRSKALARIFGEDPPIPVPRNVSPTSPAPGSRHSPSDDEADADMPLSAYAETIADSQRQKAKAIKRASTISVLSGLGVRDPEKVLDPPASPSQSTTKTATAAALKKPSKLRNFFGQRPPSELITTHLTEYFPFAEKKALRNARHSMMLRASSISGQGGRRDSTMSINPPLPSRFSTSTQGSGTVQRSLSPGRTLSQRNSIASTSNLAEKPSALLPEGPLSPEDPPRVSISTEDGHSVILTGDDVDKLSVADSKPQLPPVTFPAESLSESMEDLTNPNLTRALSRTSSNASKRTSFMTELRSKRDRSDTASLLTVDEITAEVENRRQSMAVDMGVEGADDWTKVEPDIDEVSVTSDGTVFEEVEEEDEEEPESEEDETGKAMNSSGIKWIKGALIGAGSFGKVYLGMDAVNGLLMAVKQVELPTGSAPNEERKKSMLSALEREIDLLKDLQHPNIVQYLYSSLDDDYLNIFLEYVPGGSVTALLRSYGAFEEPLVKNFVRQILQGLTYLHERDIIHRDIKGANILVDNKGGIKISDFGISKKVDGNLLTGKRMNRPSLQGSVFWMAPEVVRQTAHTSKADIWSVGCLVVEMLTGEHPFAQLTQMQAIFKIGQSAKPTIPSDISAEAQEFLTKTFDIDHEARPSAAELLQHAWLSTKKAGGASSKIALHKVTPVAEVPA
ncbi:Pkinase-domain-containing protein [Leucogyrophana mollusca]|uniref:Pkinase-domain-containing protein n=1 Tax=Leucogyrophana mollusca TaxID=85980 RepID=A0ACB8BN71_9AGAM|nr:Pkinase-domain-containing protein [Leucogyrophana mollusca]